MSETQILHILFIALGSCLTVIGGWIGKSISHLAINVEKLNEKMAVMLEKVNSHEKRISKLEKKEK